MSERRVAVIPGHGAGYQPTATTVIDYWFKRLQRLRPGRSRIVCSWMWGAVRGRC